MGKGIESNPTATAITALISGALAASVTYMYHRARTAQATQHMREQRQAERRGRIKAEVRIRSLMKEQENERVASAASSDQTTTSNNSTTARRPTHDMLLRCIGTVTCPFTKRMGTPRQGALAPHSRGYIQINPSVAPMETLSGIELYSHVWILFQFHANTDTPESRKAKIRPPRAGGLKVGTMASRSPHRPNAIGLSLVKVDRVDVRNKRLYVGALDLVNGTPVYDIKPVVPWDIPGHFPNTPPLTVPTWVSQDDALHHVTFTQSAERSLAECVRSNLLAPLYPHSQKKDDDDDDDDENDDAFQCAKEAIREVLAQDPRAAKTRGKVAGSNTDDVVVEPYRFVFGEVRLEFVVVAKGTVEVVGARRIEGGGVTGGVDGIPFSEDGTMAL